MSDSAATQWQPEAAVPTFGPEDHGPTAVELNNPNPVEVSISGNIENVNLQTTKATDITVGGYTYNFGFKGQNLHPGDVTSLNVAGSVSYPPVYAFVQVSEHLTSPNSTLSALWDALFSMMVDPNASLQLTTAEQTMTPQQLTQFVFSQDGPRAPGPRDQGSLLDPGYSANNNPGFIYDASTGKLGYRYQMSQAVFNALDRGRPSVPTHRHSLLQLDAQGDVVVNRHADGSYYLATTAATFISPTELQQLSQPKPAVGRSGQRQSPPPAAPPGPAGSTSTPARWTWAAAAASSPGAWRPTWEHRPGAGAADPLRGGGQRVTVAGDISLLTSTIASITGAM